MSVTVTETQALNAVKILLEIATQIPNDGIATVAQLHPELVKKIKDLQLEIASP